MSKTVEGMAGQCAMYLVRFSDDTQLMFWTTDLKIHTEANEIANFRSEYYDRTIIPVHIEEVFRGARRFER